VGADDKSRSLTSAAVSFEGDLADCPALRAGPWNVVPLMELVQSRRKVVSASLSTDNAANMEMRGNDEGYQDTLRG